MQTIVIHSLVWAMLLVAPAPMTHAAHAASASPAAARAHDRWPDTPAGNLARGWVEAFAGGEQKMREYQHAHFANDLIAKRTDGERSENYRKVHERFGDLTFASVVEQKPTRLKVQLLASDAAVHTFEFKTTAGAPYQLVSVSMFETHASFHGMEGWFHH